MTRIERPQVGVVIVTWNNADTISRCVSSVLRQQGVDLSIVVVDNNSSDATVAKVGAAEVLVVGNQQNVGFARAVNQGARLVHGQYLLVLNPDAALLDDDFLVTSVAAMQSNRQVATMGPRTLLPDGSVQTSAYPTPTLWREVVEGLGLYKLLTSKQRARVLLGTHFDHTTKVDAGWLLGACLLIRWDAWDAAGGLSEASHMYAEDVEWGVRMSRLGYVNRYNPERAVHHQSNHSGAAAYGSRRAVVAYEAYYVFLEKTYGSRRRWASLLINTIAFGLRAVLYTLRCRDDRQMASMARDYSAVFHMHRRWLLQRSAST